MFSEDSGGGVGGGGRGVLFEIFKSECPNIFVLIAFSSGHFRERGGRFTDGACLMRLVCLVFECVHGEHGERRTHGRCAYASCASFVSRVWFLGVDICFRRTVWEGGGGGVCVCFVRGASGELTDGACLVRLIRLL